MSSHEKLSAAANDRKSRLAHLKSLKRKQAPTEDDNSTSDANTSSSAIVRTELEEEESSVTKTYLSGRNYDPETRNVKLGFEEVPIGNKENTLEYKAEQLALESKVIQEKEEKDDKPLDLFKLQPKRPNWDLKRDLQEKMQPVDVLTENAIARLVRERVEGQKQARAVKQSGEEGENVGMEGSELVEAMHLKEREEEAERKKEEEEDDGT
ncbi:cwf18 pre-mRNA splicing factor-domain-containing protein [Dendryphion nanum]|uniref:Cwf18 pre-mRNA splicing factor-domain-containing protein n=1 Tax=Dendryphion nanum TaxID=256645 RepID=A0A9P9IMC2_9PLEO|nr:cwf18 pre-mRNA splicing factor-domain-containing protein [Dendryphion nanum]